MVHCYLTLDSSSREMHNMDPQTLVSRWRQSLKSEGRTDGTISAYTSDVSQWLTDYPARMEGTEGAWADPAGFTADSLSQWLEEIAEDEQWALSTRNRKVASIRAFLKWCDLMDVFPVSERTLRALRKVKTPEQPRRGLDTGDLVKVLEVLKARTEPERWTGLGKDQITLKIRAARVWWCVIGAMYYRALRVSSVVEANLPDVERLQNGDFMFRVRAKGGKLVEFILHAEVTPVFNEYYEERWALGKGAARGALFINPHTERRITRRAVYKHLQEAAVEALGEEGARISPHWMRHSMANHLLHVAGWALPDVRDFLGHASIETTSLYLHGREDLDRRIRALSADDLDRLARESA